MSGDILGDLLLPPVAQSSHDRVFSLKVFGSALSDVVSVSSTSIVSISVKGIHPQDYSIPHRHLLNILVILVGSGELVTVGSLNMLRNKPLL